VRQGKKQRYRNRDSETRKETNILLSIITVKDRNAETGTEMLKQRQGLRYKDRKR